MRPDPGSPTFADYQARYRELIAAPAGTSARDTPRVRIALLPSFTVKGLRETLTVKCHEQQVSAEVYEPGYNQYANEILSTDSGLSRFGPDIIFLFIDLLTILGEDYLLPYVPGHDRRDDWISGNLREIRSLVASLKTQYKAKIVLHNFNVPTRSPLGILEPKQKCGIIGSVETLNTELRRSYRDDPQVFVFDYNGFCSDFGKQRLFNYQMYYLGDIRVDFDAIPVLCDYYMPYITTLASKNKKCIVVDLDNTLWGGVVGEAGLEGIQLGPTPQGRPFVEFQKYLLSLNQRGIILAINSKNNFDDAWRVITGHPSMVLRDQNFAAYRINWEDKISNMKGLAAELNIGLDSMVFLDDDKVNQEMVRQALPDVMVVDLPSDPSQYLKTLMELRVFDTFQITEEDLRKGKMYAEQRKRTEFFRETTNIDDYLRGLSMDVTIEKAGSFSIPRISQLCQKTNQFNMTTKRYLDEDIRRMAEDPAFLVYAVSVKDRFGDNGLSGVVIVKKGPDCWVIDTFLLSCRIIGRRIEDAILGTIMHLAQGQGAGELIGEFRETKKNAPAQGFYRKNGFTLRGTTDSTEQWVFDLKKRFEVPDFIRIRVTG